MTELDIIWLLGIRTSLLSARQLVVALRIVHEQEDSLYRITKDLYPQVAKHFHTNPRNVERNLRSVIDRCWYYGSKEQLQQMAGGMLFDKPTVKEFIDILHTYWLRHEQRLPEFCSSANSQNEPPIIT